MIIRHLPEWAMMGAITLGHTVYVKPSMEKDGITIPHESVHVRQQERDGSWRFYWRYVTSAKWRVRYESEAYAESVRRGMKIEEAARFLSSSLYLWPCSYADALLSIWGFLP